MSYTKGQIPSDNATNLQRLKDIRAHWTTKYENLSAKRDELDDRIQVTEGFHQVTLMRKREEINNVMTDLYGKLENNADKIHDLEDYMAELEASAAPLTQRPFEELGE